MLPSVTGVVLAVLVAGFSSCGGSTDAPPTSMGTAIEELMNASAKYCADAEAGRGFLERTDPETLDEGWALLGLSLEVLGLSSYPGADDDAVQARQMLLADPEAAALAIEARLRRDVEAERLLFLYELLQEVSGVHFASRFAGASGPLEPSTPPTRNGLRDQLFSVLTEWRGDGVFQRIDELQESNPARRALAERLNLYQEDARAAAVLEVLAPGETARAELPGLRVEIVADLGFGRRYRLSTAAGPGRAGWIVLAPREPYPDVQSGAGGWFLANSETGSLRWDDSPLPRFWKGVELADTYEMSRLSEARTHLVDEVHPTGLPGPLTGVLEEGCIDFPAQAALTRWWVETPGLKAAGAEGVVLVWTQEERVSLGLWRLTVAGQVPEELPRADGELVLARP